MGQRGRLCCRSSKSRWSPTLFDEMVLKLELRNFGEAGPLEVLSLNLGPSGVHIEQLLKLRQKVNQMLLST